MLGLTFQIGAHRLALDVRRVVDVVPSISLQAVAGGPVWLAGAALFRGHVVPVIDLYRLMDAGDCPIHLSTRIIFVQISIDDQLQLLGLRASKVADIRELPLHADAVMPTTPSERPDLGKVFVHEGEIFHLVDLDRLLPETYRRAAWARCQELAT